ncbi:hybrid sensor histidine kinase/response regulator transcription factor [Larkinella soli]|uniref:hybrid sensor histidine kinase/response regulator transcription factor n=1 Tax=Larkinella soli TaxID=1770527 RepID=UPI000FFB9631|nr:ATP-binding protein [Larkinella soli]
MKSGSFYTTLFEPIRIAGLIWIIWASPWFRAVSARQLPQPGFITDRQGLPQAFVPSILQDRQGFIWVATRDGLCRYDGHQFRIFQPDPDGRPSLSFAGLEQLSPDHRGQIWIVSEQGDIDVFNPITETFTNLSRQPALRRLLTGRSPYRVRVDRRDRLWIILKNRGVLCWHLKSRRGRWFRHLPSRAGSNRHDAVHDLVEGKDGTIWLATANGLNRFDEGTQRFVLIERPPIQAGDPSDHHLVGIHPRPTGELLLLARRHLTLFQPHTGRWRSYALPAQGNQWEDTHFAEDRQGTVYFDQNNILFRFTDRDGVRIADRLNQPTDACASLFIDRTDVLWVGTNGAGIRTYDLRPNPFYTRRYERGFHLDLLTSGTFGIPPVPAPVLSALDGLISYNLRSTFDASGRWWFNVGSSDIYRLDIARNQIHHLPLPVPFRSRLAGDTPCPLATDPQGSVWAVYGHQAYRYEENRKRWVRLAHPVPRQPAGTVTAFVVDARSLWLASRTGGLWQLDRQTGRTRRFVNQPGDPASLSSNSLYCVAADPDDPHRLWVGTFGNGLCLFDKRTGRFRRFSQANGLPNNVVYSALPDRRGDLWMGTNKGLCRMNRRTFAVRTFTRDDGLLADEFNSNHFIAFPDGKILMGGLEGFTVFYPRQIVDDPVEPMVELTELQINNQLIRPDRPATGRSGAGPGAVEPASPLGNRPLHAADRLLLAYDQNYLTFRFAALQFNRPAKNRYRYRLEGLEAAWKPVDQPEAVYTNLPSGRYTLLVNASNTSGRWSPHVRRLAITIRPPIWATWWAYGLYGLLGLAVLLVSVRIYLNRLQLRQAIRLRRQEAEQLRKLDGLKTTFFTNITHELRTPLTLILGPAQQMMSEDRSVKDRLRLSTIDRQAHQLLRLVNQWLDFARLEAGAQPVHLIRGEPGVLIGEWAAPFAQEAQNRGCRFSYRCTAGGAYWFDREKFERIVTNLLGNAVKFTPAGEQIRVELAPSTAREGIELTVADTGRGIPADALPRIFERFYQADATPASGQPGTGIGLALVKELIELQQGTVAVQSEPGQGTTFRVWLPFPPAGPMDSAKPPETGGENGIVPPAETDVNDSSPDRVSGESPTVLLVEDNAELADFIAGSLPSAYRIYRAEQGHQGFEQALAQMPDVIISDVLMPVMDGLELCRRLKADVRTNHLPVILLTAKSSLDSRLEGLSVGADEYLTKPFHVRELQIRIGNLLQQRQRLREHIRAGLTGLDAPPSGPGSPPADTFITGLYALIDTHLDESDYGVEQLAAQAGMSRSYLFRKVKALSGLSASELLRNYRLKRATEYLRQGYGIAETGYLVGFESPAYFTKCFRELYALTPTEFLARHAQTG